MKAAGSFVIRTHCFSARFCLWQKYSLLGGACPWCRRWVFPFVHQAVPKTHSEEKAFLSFNPPSPRPSPPQQASALLPPSTEGSLSFDMYSCHFTFSFLLPGLSWRRRNGRETIVFSFLQLPVKGSSRLCALAALEREGWETTKHLSPNYSPNVRAVLSCSGYSLLTVWVVWLAEAADFKAVALSCVNASNPNPSSSEQPGPNGGTAPQWRGDRGSPLWHYFCGEGGEKDLKSFTLSC